MPNQSHQLRQRRPRRQNHPGRAQASRARGRELLLSEGIAPHHNGSRPRARFLASWCRRAASRRP